MRNSYNKAYVPLVARRSARHSIRGVDYHVNEWGESSRPLLVLLHGFGDAGSTFQFLVDQLKSDWFVIAPDWRGFGDSSLRARSYWFPDYVADLEALLAIYSPEKPANLIGHSMGGNIAGLYSGVFPERVAAFVNVEGFGLADRDPAEAPANYRRWIEASYKAEQYRSYDSFAELAQRIRKQSPHLSSEMALFVAQQWAACDEDGQIKIKADPAHKIPNAVLFRRNELEACWRQVTAQVLFVVGAESNFWRAAMPKLGTDPSSLPFPSASLTTIKDAGHMIHFEQPTALAATVENFVGVGPQ
jgi:pimeloyl-ACP methyl ester carboxylesterase